MKDRSPFRALMPLFRGPFGEEAEALWDRMWGGGEGTGRWTPRVDVVEKPEAFLVKAEMPGLEAEDIEVNLTGNTLTISGEKKEEKKKEGEHYKVFERRYGAFERTITFPAPVDAEKVEAEVANGVLTVQVMKKEQAKASKIKVKGR